MLLKDIFEEDLVSLEEMEELDSGQNEDPSYLNVGSKQLDSSEARKIFDMAIGLLGHANVASMLLDKNLFIMYTSDAVYELFKNYRKIERKPFFNIFGNSLDKDELSLFLHSLKDIKSGFSWSGILSHRIRHKRTLYTKTSVFPLFSEKELSGYWVIFEDVTDTMFMQYKNMMGSLLSASKLKDNDTGVHNERLNDYAEALSIALFKKEVFPQIDIDFIENISTLAAIHDIGKIGTPDYILQKKGPLTPAEWTVMKEHTINGTLIMSSYPIPMAKEITLSHHEKWDGSGYPYNLSGDMIPLSARIVALGDVYDALRMERVYKNAMSHKDTVDYIIGNSSSHFDPKIISVFKNIYDEFDEIWKRSGD